MVVTVDQMREGMARYADRELIDRSNGIMKWGLALVGMNAVDMACKAMRDNCNTLCTLGYMTEDGLVDLDKLYEELSKIAKEKGDIVQHLPIAGDVRFTSSDIDMLRRYIAG